MGQSYDVFMSYRHRPLDEEITRRSFNFLEKYTLPSSLKNSGFRTIQRVFRDTEELPVSRILTNTIDDALRSADYLVVVCSPSTPESEWIDREVSTFTEMGKACSVYPLLISGSPEESFPRALKAIPDISDRVLDARCESGKADAIMKKAEGLLLRVVAAVAGCSDEKLKKAQAMRASKRSLAAGLTAFAVFALVAGVSAGLMRLAENYRAEAKQSQNVSMTVLQELTYGLPNDLADLPGTYSKLTGILGENAEIITDILELSGNSPEVRYEIGANYDKLSTAYRTIGQLDRAEEASLRALSEFSAIDENSASVASTCNNLGGILNAAGRYTDAGEYFDRAVSLQGRIAGTDAQLAQYMANAGANAVSTGNVEDGIALLSQSLELAAPEDWPDAESVANAYLQYGKGLRLLMRYEEAESALARSAEYYLSAENLTRNILSGALNAQTELAGCLYETGRYSDASDIYRSIIPVAEELASDGENTVFLTQLAGLYVNCAGSLNMLGSLEEAQEMSIRGAEIFRRLAEATGTDSDRGSYARACINIGDTAFTMGEYAESEKWFSLGLDEYGKVAANLGDYHLSNYLSYLSFYELTFGGDAWAALCDAEDAYNHYASLLSCGYYGVACMFNGYTDAADELFDLLAQNGAGGQIRQLLEALSAYGLQHEHTAYVLENFT